jgi:murein DD-endopeptidase MepM/ murein hydrolase activator NlpD
MRSTAGKLFLLSAAFSATVFAALVAALFLTMSAQGEGGDIKTSLISSCSVIPQTNATVDGLTNEQIHNAGIIVSVGKQAKVPPRGWTIALMAALQESGLRNIPYGDRDSVGLFQQRTAWGPFADRMDPAKSSLMFYTGGQAGQPGLLDIAGWQGMDLGQAAQAVQRSAFPFAYAKHEQLATSLVKKLAGTDPGSCNEQIAPGAWVVPTIRSYHLTSRFGPRIDPVRHTLGFHTGLDFAVPIGSPVYAATGGIVISTGWGGGYGNLVKLQHADGVQTWYAHLSAFAVTPGTKVNAGTEIARSGTTGNSTGPHLHFEVRVDGQPRDPEAWLPAHGVPLNGGGG